MRILLLHLFELLEEEVAGAIDMSYVMDHFFTSTVPKQGRTAIIRVMLYAVHMARLANSQPRPPIIDNEEPPRCTMTAAHVPSGGCCSAVNEGAGASTVLPPRRLIVGRFVDGARFRDSAGGGCSRCCCATSCCCCCGCAAVLLSGPACASGAAAHAGSVSVAAPSAGGFRKAKDMKSEEAVASEGSQSRNVGWKCLNTLPASPWTHREVNIDHTTGFGKHVQRTPACTLHSHLIYNQ